MENKTSQNPFTGLVERFVPGLIFTPGLFPGRKGNAARISRRKDLRQLTRTQIKPATKKRAVPHRHPSQRETVEESAGRHREAPGDPSERETYTTDRRRCCAGPGQSRLCRRRNSCCWCWQNLWIPEGNSEAPGEERTGCLLGCAAYLEGTGEDDGGVRGNRLAKAGGGNVHLLPP